MPVGPPWRQPLEIVDWLRGGFRRHRRSDKGAGRPGCQGSSPPLDPVDPEKSPPRAIPSQRRTVLPAALARSFGSPRHRAPVARHARPLSTPDSVRPRTSPRRGLFRGAPQSQGGVDLDLDVHNSDHAVSAQIVDGRDLSQCLVDHELHICHVRGPVVVDVAFPPGI